MWPVPPITTTFIQEASQFLGPIEVTPGPLPRESERWKPADLGSSVENGSRQRLPLKLCLIQVAASRRNEEISLVVAPEGAARHLGNRELDGTREVTSGVEVPEAPTTPKSEPNPTVSVPGHAIRKSPINGETEKGPSVGNLARTEVEIEHLHPTCWGIDMVHEAVVGAPGDAIRGNYVRHDL